MNFNHFRRYKAGILFLLIFINSISFGQQNKQAQTIKDTYSISIESLNGPVKEVTAITQSVNPNQVIDTIVYKLNKAKDTAIYTSVPRNTHAGHHGEMYYFQYHLFNRKGRMISWQSYKGNIKEKEEVLKEEQYTPVKVEIKKSGNDADTIRSYYNKAGLLVKKTSRKNYEPLMWITTFKYDLHENLTEEAMFMDLEGNGKKVVRTRCESATYKYDSFGNWIYRKKTFSSNILPNDPQYILFTRTITYW